MIEQNNLHSHLHFQRLFKRALQGAGIALVVMVIFLFNGGNSGYDFWVFVPMITVSVGGALGGIFYYLMDRLRYHGSWKKALANIISLLVYILFVWISSIPGLKVIGLWD